MKSMMTCRVFVLYSNLQFIRKFKFNKKWVWCQRKRPRVNRGLFNVAVFALIVITQVHYAVGFGGRLALNKTEKLHARGDLSLVDGKHIGITIDLRESF